MLTGVYALDRFIDEVPSEWIVEFYGSWEIVEALMHRVVALNSDNSRVAVVITQEFGGLDPYRILRMVKTFRMGEGEILFARAFKIEDTLALLELAVRKGFPRVVVVDPYLHLGNNPREYWLATAITSRIRKILARGSEVALFNRVSKFGEFLPEGGNYHHHTVHVLIRLSRGHRSVKAELVKHPFRPYSVTYFSPAELFTPPAFGKGSLLTWLRGDDFGQDSAYA